jgi:hypothetical protein
MAEHDKWRQEQSPKTERRLPERGRQHAQTFDGILDAGLLLVVSKVG